MQGIHFWERAKLPRRDAKPSLVTQLVNDFGPVPEAALCHRHKPKPTAPNSRHQPLSREKHQLCPTFTEPAVKRWAVKDTVL